MTDLQIDENAARGKVYEFRRALHAAGFVPLAGLTGTKECREPGWSDEWRKEDPTCTVTPPQADKMNTGILCRGLRVLDFDYGNAVSAETVKAVEAAALKHLGATVRRWREGSPRCALFYRAAENPPPGWSEIKGIHGNIEIRGDGNYLALDGIHPDGKPYRLSAPPDDGFALDTLPCVTQAQIDTFSDEVKPLIGEVRETERKAAKTKTHASDEGFFDTLPPHAQLKAVSAAFGRIDNTANDDRKQWLSLTWAATDAERRGCAGAIEAAREWARRGARYNGEESEAAFDRNVAGFKQMPDGITVGSLIGAAGGWSGLGDIYAKNLFCSVPASAPSDAASAPLSGGEYVPLARRLADIKPDESPHLVDGILRERAIGLIFGPSYVGKTIIASNLAFHIACGTRFMGHECQKGATYIIESEGVELVADNLRAHYKAAGISDADADIFISGEYLDLLDAESVERTTADIEYYARVAGGIKLIIVDTLSQSIAGRDENGQGVMSAALKAIALAGRRTGAATLIIHHTGKKEELGSRGSNVLPAGADSVINLADGGSNLVKMTPSKFKGGRCAPPEYFRIDGVTLRLDHRGRDVTAGIAVHVLAADAKAAQTEVRLTPPEQAVMAALAGAWPGGEITKAELQRRFNQHYFSTSEKLNTRNKAMNRGLRDLAPKGLICVSGNGDLFCLATPPRRLTEATKTFGPMQ